MTHDELLEMINAYTICDRATKPAMVCDNKHLKEIYPEWFALKAVVELHAPNEWGICDTCNIGDYVVKYPCSTIQAIEKELA